jgi:hypothetical protein
MIAFINYRVMYGLKPVLGRHVRGNTDGETIVC